VTNPFPDWVSLKGRALRATSITALGSIAVLVLGCQFLSPSDGQAGGPDDPPIIVGQAGGQSDGQAGGPEDDRGEGPGDSPTDARVFQSNWSTATGTGDHAVSDGGKWDNFYCESSVRARVLSVVPGPSHGWTATPNVLQITNAGSANCGMIENASDIPQTANNYYIRMYIRVTNVGSGGLTFHSVKMAVLNPIQAIYWGIHSPVTNTSYVPRFNFTERTGMAQFGYSGPVLAQNAWYRFEYHVEYYDPANPLRYRVWPRVYDMSGALVADATGYRSNDDGPARSLAQHYDAEGYGTAGSRDRGRFLSMGYEGTSGNNDLGGSWYYAGVEVRTDSWPGPIRP